MATLAALHTQTLTTFTPSQLQLGETPRFTVDAAQCTLTRGAVSPAAVAWLEAHGAREFAALTAADPHSLALSPDENRRRHRSLVRALVFDGARFVEVAGENGQPAVVVFDLGAERAAALGRAYAQGCVLVGDRRHARVVACEALEFHI